MKVLHPPGWPRPKGYSNGVSARGRLIFTAGVIGWDAEERIVSDTLPGQLEQVLRNILAILAAGGAGAEHLARMTWYVTDRDEYAAHLPEIGAAWRAVMGPVYPPMAVVIVAGLVEPRAKVEIEAIAVVPD